MTLRNFLFFALIFCTATSFSQNQKNVNLEFQKYARTQDSLTREAYKQRNVKVYTVLLNDYTMKYEKLSKEDKEYFKGNYINSFYNLSCTYALLNDKPNALLYLDKSIKAGYNNYAHIKKDSDLDILRNEAQYRTITQPLRETGDYMYVLKKAGQYNTNENRELPKFTYQSADNPNLVALRKAFNLDSIAGTGNEVSRILNLLHWIHNLVPHDGSNENPTVKNAMNMIAVCKKDKRGLNCRGLSTVLNECYLSLGIKSRFVTCLPKDSLGIDNDCHVINMVYSTQLKKWLWIDPTFDAYIMNEQGELLGMEEVRDRIINDKPLILNPEANWNRRNSQKKEDYLYNYMAKNLYILECPISSEYDTETKEAGKNINYLQLLPLDYFKKSLEKTSSTNKVNQTTLTGYKTNNPNIFWQIP
jgi:hypothetical protein